MLLTSIGQAFTLLPIIILALSNSDPARATSFAAYIQIMRLGGAEIGVALMGTWLRVREQIHSNYLGQHIENGSGDVVRMLQTALGFLCQPRRGQRRRRGRWERCRRPWRARPTRSLTSTAFGCASGWRW